MEHHEKAGCLFPKIGMRNVKTALAAALCALVYYFLDRNPTFACIGAIFGMGSSFMQSRLHGGNRFFGTMVGGFIGMGLFAIYMELFPDGSNAWVLIPLTFVGVIILILLCQHIWVGGVQPGGVVLCILLFNTPTDTYITYAMNRILDRHRRAGGDFCQWDAARRLHLLFYAQALPASGDPGRCRG